MLSMVQTEVDDEDHCVVLEGSVSEDVKHGERDHVRTGGLELTRAGCDTMCALARLRHARRASEPVHGFRRARTKLSHRQR